MVTDSCWDCTSFYSSPRLKGEFHSSSPLRMKESTCSTRYPDTVCNRHAGPQCPFTLCLLKTWNVEVAVCCSNLTLECTNMFLLNTDFVALNILFPPAGSATSARLSIWHFTVDRCHILLWYWVDVVVHQVKRVWLHCVPVPSEVTCLNSELTSLLSEACSNHKDWKENGIYFASLRGRVIHASLAIPSNSAQYLFFVLKTSAADQS